MRLSLSLNWVLAVVVCGASSAPNTASELHRSVESTPGLPPGSPGRGVGEWWYAARRAGGWPGRGVAGWGLRDRGGLREQGGDPPKAARRPELAAARRLWRPGRPDPRLTRDRRATGSVGRLAISTRRCSTPS